MPCSRSECRNFHAGPLLVLVEVSGFFRQSIERRRSLLPTSEKGVRFHGSVLEVPPRCGSSVAIGRARPKSFALHHGLRSGEVELVPGRWCRPHDQAPTGSALIFLIDRAAMSRCRFDPLDRMHVFEMNRIRFSQSTSRTRVGPEPLRSIDFSKTNWSRIDPLYGPGLGATRWHASWNPAAQAC
jgi:hypothetical protein